MATAPKLVEQFHAEAVVHSATRAIEPSPERDSTARKRHQKGYVYLDGEKRKGRYREDVLTAQGTRRIRRQVILGTKQEIPTKRLAERRMEMRLARISALDYRPGRIATFEEFIERWKTEVLTKQKPSSARVVESHLRCVWAAFCVSVPNGVG